MSGYANWLVYTPAMLYAVAQHYLLSNDALGLRAPAPARPRRRWTGASRQIAQTLARRGAGARPRPRPAQRPHRAGRLGVQPGVPLRGPRSLRARARAARALRAPPTRAQAAHAIRESIARGFGAASVRSPLVQLRDGTWMPYVPAEALTPRRLLDQWYATDVDTGAVHLLRLKALPARGLLADALLNDHEDNLFYKGWGIANEPVYNQHATAYLLRDEPEAAVRAFYSYMASALQPLRLRTGGASLDARPVLRAAEHRRRVVRALPQHARPRARRRRAGPRSGDPARLAARRPEDRARARADVLRRHLAATSRAARGRARFAPSIRMPSPGQRPSAVWSGSGIPTASACER